VVPPVPLGTGALALHHPLAYPTRLTEGPTGLLYVTDARQGSVFLLDPALKPLGELEGVGGPLGVAIGGDGTLYVGSRRDRSIHCFDAAGNPTRIVGAGTLEMPNDLALDRLGNLYVADSTANRVQVFDPAGALLRTVGTPGAAAGQLSFPAGVAIAYPPAHPEGELYVADQGNGRVSVFDLEGSFRRTLGQAATAFFGAWQGSFARLQGLAVDALGRVHALDAYQNVVQVLDGETGSFIESYGSFGTGVGQLTVPLGIAILRDGRVVVANAENRRLEELRLLAPGQGG
jgi:DNA-binding beta-propeller fold protein YncE